MSKPSCQSNTSTLRAARAGARRAVSPGDSAPYPFQGGTPSGTAGPRREGLM